MDDFFKISGQVTIEHRNSNGELLNYRQHRNLVTTSGKILCGMLFNSMTSNASAVQYILLGSNATAIAASTIQLGEWSSSGIGLKRAIATTSMITSTARFVHVFTCNAAGTTVQEEGLAQGTTAGGILAAVQTFASITLNSGDSLSCTHDLSFA